MQLVRAAGQALSVDGLPSGTQVSIAGTVVQPASDGTFPIPVGQEVDVVVSRGAQELFRTRVPATQAGQRVNVRYVEPQMAPYEPGSRDDVRNRAAKGKAGMSIFGLGVLGGAIVGIVKAIRD